MKFLTEFIFNTSNEAINVWNALFNSVKEKGYISYSEVYYLTNDINKEHELPEIYYNNGWTWAELLGTRIEMISGDYDDIKWKLIFPQIRKLENIIKKENKDEK